VREVEAEERAERAQALARLAAQAPSARVLLVHLLTEPGRHACVACWEYTRTLSVWTPSQGGQDWGVPSDIAVFALIPLCDTCSALYDSGAAPWPAGVESDIQAAVRAELRREGVI
jgi:hypothetical protein